MGGPFNRECGEHEVIARSDCFSLRRFFFVSAPLGFALAMSSSLLERTRAYQEDIDQYEDACAELLLEEASRVRLV